MENSLIVGAHFSKIDSFYMNWASYRALQDMTIFVTKFVPWLIGALIGGSRLN